MPETTTTVRPCTPQDVGLAYTDKTEQWVKDACEKYFAQFDAPRISSRPNGLLMSSWECACGRPLGGYIGSFTWGIVHGEGFCTNCKRPGRAFHRLVDDKGEEFATLGPIILMYRQEDPCPTS